MIARSITTFLMWVTYLAVLYMSQSELGGGVIVFGGVLMIPLIVASLAMWDSFSEGKSSSKEEENVSKAEVEKRKRDRLDAVLRELSDEQLAALKARLSEADFEERVEYMLGDDGEIVERSS